MRGKNTYQRYDGVSMMKQQISYIYNLDNYHLHNDSQKHSQKQPSDTIFFDELALLSRLHQAGIAITPMHIISPEVETNFYKLNNLPEQLSQLFQQVDLQYPDEDDIEEIAPQAQALLQQSYLLDEVIDAFYASLEHAPEWLCLRYPYPYSLDIADVEHKVLRGRPSLMRLKALWRARWSYEALWARLEQQHSIALQSYPILMHAPSVIEMNEMPADMADILDSAANTVRIFVDEAGRIAHLRL